MNFGKARQYLTIQLIERRKPMQKSHRSGGFLLKTNNNPA
jgi:hypothetical protein